MSDIPIEGIETMCLRECGGFWWCEKEKDMVKYG